MEQVVMNLVVNARDAMPRGGRLTIRTQNDVIEPEDPLAIAGQPPGEYVRLSVADTGTGMTESVKAKVFEPFFTTKGVGKGTGLGLATVYGIVKQAGGQIDVSTALGQGTTFAILLPAVPDGPQQLATSGLDSSLRGHETVLLVEDEQALRKFARLALESHGYQVKEAGNGTEAIRLAGHHDGSIHLLVTDVVMPGMGGRDLAEVIRSQFPTVRVLYMSGYTDDAIVRHGIVEATDAFLQKPFTPQGLVRKVRATLDAAT
jgi:CheY-like chemotaxis protein